MAKICFFINSPGWGGSEINAIKLIEHLQMKHEVQLYLNPEPSSQLKKIIVGNKHPYKTLKAGAGIGFFFYNLCYLLASFSTFNNSINIVWCHHLDSNRWMQLLLSVFGMRPIVVEQLLPEEYEANFTKSRLTRPVKRITAKRATMVVCGYSQQDAYSKHFAPAKLEVIPNTRDISQIIAQTIVSQSRHDMQERKYVRLLTVCRLEEQKDITSQICAVDILKKRGYNVQLTVVGAGSLLESYKKLAIELQVQDQISFEGQQPQVLPYLNSADIFILSSLSEGLPGALIEAMAASLPCIATNISGNNELILHEQTGLLVPVKQPIALAEAVERFIKDQDFASQCGKRALLHVQANYSLETGNMKWDRIISFQLPQK